VVRTPVSGPLHAVEALQDAAGNRAAASLLNGSSVDAAPDAAQAGLRSPDRGLDPDTRRGMEAAFQSDFSGVRIHTGGAAGAAARRLRAKAFTLGRDIVFAPRRYAPETGAGLHLLAHELAHVLQQRQAGARDGSADVLEQQAGRAAQEVVVGSRMHTVLSPAPAAVQRSPEDDGAGYPTATKSAAKIHIFKIPVRNIGEVSLKIAVSPAGSGKDKPIPKQLMPEMELEIAEEVALKLKTDVLTFSTDEWPHRLGGLSFQGKLSAEFLEAEVAAGETSFSVVKIKGEYQSIDLTRFGARVKLELEFKVKPENLLRGREKQLLKQFQKLMDDTQKTTKRIAKNCAKLETAEEGLRRAEKELANGRNQIKRFSRQFKGKPPRGAEKAMLKELKADIRRMEKGIADQKRSIRHLKKGIKNDRKLFRRLTSQAARVVRSSKNPVFRLLTSSIAKAVGTRLAHLIPVLGALMLAYDVVVFLRNLTLGRLSWGVFGEGDPWGEEVGEPGAEGKPGAGDARAGAPADARAPMGKQGEPGQGRNAGAPVPTPSMDGAAGGPGGDVDAEIDGGVLGEQAGEDVANGEPDTDVAQGRADGSAGTLPFDGGAPGDSEKEPEAAGVRTGGKSATKTPAPDAEAEAEPGGGKERGGKRGAKDRGAGGAGRARKARTGSGAAADKIVSVHSNIFTRIRGYNPNMAYTKGDELRITASFTVGKKQMQRTFWVVVETPPYAAGDEIHAVVRNRDMWEFTVDKTKHVMAEGEPIELISAKK
jgi:hypothetical protein